MQQKIFLGLALTLVIVIFIPIYWATEAGRQEAASERMGETGPPPQAATAAAPTSSGQAIFEQECQSCHTIGGGPSVGPDLEGITEQRERDWLVRFIVSPEEVLAGGDPIAQQLLEEYGMPMPDLGLSDDEAEEVLAYISEQSGEAGAPATPEPEEPAPLLSGDPGTGGDIFSGRRPLENGGAACLACHGAEGIGALGGGTVGRDLTGTHDRLGQQGLASVLKAPPFPIMTEIYAERPLTDEEIAHLVAYLQEVDAGEKPARTQNPAIFPVAGVIGFILVLIMVNFSWKGRLSGVRRTLVKGGSK